MGTPERAVRMNELLRAAGVGEAELDAVTKDFRAWRKSRRR